MKSLAEMLGLGKPTNISENLTNTCNKKPQSDSLMSQSIHHESTTATTSNNQSVADHSFGKDDQPAAPPSSSKQRRRRSKNDGIRVYGSS